MNLQIWCTLHLKIDDALLVKKKYTEYHRLRLIVGKSKNTKAKFEKVRTEFTRDEKFLSFAPPKSEAKKIQAQGKDGIDYEEIFGDSCTVGSTSKSSSEWRSSINCRDSGTEDPFSSSSRRSCPKWESYTVFQKYDEEMLFLDRISAQKLHETGTIFKLNFGLKRAFLLSNGSLVTSNAASINQTVTI